jgi:hypothetical protein
MNAPPRPRPTALQAITLTVVGLVLALFGLRSAAAAFESGSESMPVAAIVELCVGAPLLAVGAMMLLVVLVRPLFAKRPVDERADRWRPGPGA